MLEKIAQNQRQLFLTLLMLLVVSIVVVYYPSLAVPFYLDDQDSIVTNLAIHAESLDLLLQSGLDRRLIGYFSLWANYQIGGLDPVGYHVVNIVIHIINSLLVFVMVLQLIRYFNPSEQIDTRRQQMLWALVVAAIWALHPLNSQTVTYVVQRLASIVTLFYLLTIISYIQLRQQSSKPKAVAYGLLLLGCIIGGLHAKENFVSVFAFLYCWELLTCTVRVRRHLLTITTAAVFTLLVFAPFLADFWLMLNVYTRDVYASSRGDYFYTQQLVLWDYIWRFIYPINLQLNIDTVLETRLAPMVALAMLSHIIVISVTYKYRKLIPLLFVGVAFFYASHLVESFAIPIKDLAFEHRTYIGNIGLLLAVASVLQFWWLKQPRSNAVNLSIVFTVVAVLLVFSFGTIKRNMLWQTPLEFYANEVALAPQQDRANTSYGTELMKVDRFDEAEPYLKKSVDMNLAKNKVTASGLTAYMTALYHQKKYQKASSVAMLGLTYVKKPLERSALIGNLAYGYMQMGIYDFAKGLLTTALDLDPNNSEARSNLELCLIKLKQSGR
ncbi:MAG: tetratricopeptide (TPR) repeat protein [Phenylobacterium sp.]